MPFESISRRGFVSSACIAAAATPLWVAQSAAQTATAARAEETVEGSLISKAAPRIGGSLPAIGLGTFAAFDAIPGAPRSHLEAVIREYCAAGGRLIDTSPLYGTAEVSVGNFANALGVSEQLLIANKIWSTGEYLWDESHARRSLERSLERLWRQTIDIMQCHSLVNVDVVVPILKAWRAEGLVRHIGVTHHEPPYFGVLADWVERGELDVVQVHYSILTREAERRILPAAAERGMAVLVNMPFEKARLLKLVEGRALPSFAEEWGARSWAQLFLKWVISHPAVTCALPATSNPRHMIDNMGAMRGALPDQGMRARFVKFMEAIPGFAELSRMPWYPDKQYSGVTGRAQSALRRRAGG